MVSNDAKGRNMAWFGKLGAAYLQILPYSGFSKFGYPQIILWYSLLVKMTLFGFPIFRNTHIKHQKINLINNHGCNWAHSGTSSCWLAKDCQHNCWWRAQTFFNPNTNPGSHMRHKWVEVQDSLQIPTKENLKSDEPPARMADCPAAQKQLQGSVQSCPQDMGDQTRVVGIRSQPTKRMLTLTPFRKNQQLHGKKEFYLIKAILSTPIVTHLSAGWVKNDGFHRGSTLGFSRPGTFDPYLRLRGTCACYQPPH